MAHNPIPATTLSDSDELSAKMRQYLMEIYRLADTYPAPEYVSTSALADAIFVSPPAVNRMINRLKELGLLQHEPYQGVRLTPLGLTEALKALRAQYLVEAFLITVMGMDWGEATRESVQLCQNLSERILNRMADMAGNPSFSVQGEPIPSATGDIVHLMDKRLSDTQAGQKVRITRLHTREPDRLNYLKALGLVPHTELEVYHIAPFNGPMQLRLHGEYRIIGHNLAELIHCQPLTE